MKKTLVLVLLLTGCAYGKYENFDVDVTPVLKVDSRSSQEQIEKYLLTQYKDSEVEQIRVVLLDNEGRYIEDKLFSTGGLRMVSMSSIVDIHRYALLHNSKNIRIYHNHVSEWFARPSVADAIAANEIYDYAKANHINIKSIILSKRDAYEQPLDERYHIPAEPLYIPDGAMGTFSTPDNVSKRKQFLIDAGFRDRDAVK